MCTFACFGIAGRASYACASYISTSYTFAYFEEKDPQGTGGGGAAAAAAVYSQQADLLGFDSPPAGPQGAPADTPPFASGEDAASERALLRRLVNAAVDNLCIYIFTYVHVPLIFLSYIYIYLYIYGHACHFVYLLMRSIDTYA